MKRTKDQQFTEYVNSSSLASQHPRVSILHTQSGTSQVAGQVPGFQVIQGMAACMCICFISGGRNARKWPAFVMDVHIFRHQPNHHISKLQLDSKGETHHEHGV